MEINDLTPNSTFDALKEFLQSQSERIVKLEAELIRVATSHHGEIAKLIAEQNSLRQNIESLRGLVDRVLEAVKPPDADVTKGGLPS